MENKQHSYTLEAYNSTASIRKINLVKVSVSASTEKRAISTAKKLVKRETYMVTHVYEETE